MIDFLEYVFGEGLDSTENERKPLTISELNLQLKTILETSFPYVWVEGEVSNFHESERGHWYFSLKERSSQIKAICLSNRISRIGFTIRNGMHVQVWGKITTYEQRSEYQIFVESLAPHGTGAMQQALEQIKNKLQNEGLFDEYRKKPLPLLIRRVGVITSLRGAAVRDILKVLEEIKIRITLIPTIVQGEMASSRIASAIKLANFYNKICKGEEKIDVLIVGRGGGSIEDLWAFNEEEVARAIACSQIPVISAVGHDIDFTVADLVADFRATTPTAAAKMLVEHQKKLQEHIQELRKELLQSISRSVLEEKEKFSEIKLSFLHNTNQIAKRFDKRLGDLELNLRQTISKCLSLRKDGLATLREKVLPVMQSFLQSEKASLFILGQRLLSAKSFIEKSRNFLEVKKASLDALSPLAILNRGYAIVLNKEGKVVKDSTQVEIGESIEIKIAEGKLTSIVTGK